MKRIATGIGIGVLLAFGGRYCINNSWEKVVQVFQNNDNNEEKVVQVLQSYNKVDDDKEEKADKNEELYFDTNNILGSIKGIWGNGVMCSYQLDSKPTEDIMRKYSNLARKNIIVSDHRYFNIFDSIYYDKVFKDPYYKISKIDGKIVDDNDKSLYIRESTLSGLYIDGPVYKIIVTDEKNKRDNNYEDSPIFYTNGSILRVDYKGCSFRYTKLN